MRLKLQSSSTFYRTKVLGRSLGKLPDIHQIASHEIIKTHYLIAFSSVLIPKVAAPKASTTSYQHFYFSRLNTKFFQVGAQPFIKGAG